MSGLVNLVWAVGPELGPLELLSLETWCAQDLDVNLWTYDPFWVRAAPGRVKRMQLDQVAPRESMFTFSSEHGFRPHSGKGSLSHWNDMLEMTFLHMFGGWFSQLDVTVHELPELGGQAWFPPLAGWPGAAYQTCVASAPAGSPWLLEARAAMQSYFRPRLDHWFRCLELIDPVLRAAGLPAGGQGVVFEDNCGGRFMAGTERPAGGVHFCHWSRAGLDGRQNTPVRGSYYAELLEQLGLLK